MTRRLLTTVTAMAAVVGLTATVALAAPTIEYDEVPLTQPELDANWGIDRAVPSGGYESVSFEGRENVLELRVDPDNRSSDSSFFYTEGLKRQTTDAAALKADLYVDPTWAGQDIRAGLWPVGHDPDEGSAYPIVEYYQDTTLGESGWRVWDSVTGWVDHPGTTGPGDWATLEVILDVDADEVTLSVDGVSVTLPALGTTTLGHAIFNTFNFGPGTPAYEVHFSNFAVGEVFEGPVSKDDCRNGGYADFGFKNQGLCVKSLTANT
jgi:hypothetical protein